jgi:membrane fusion protein, heavy metal efflux system
MLSPEPSQPFAKVTLTPPVWFIVGILACCVCILATAGWFSYRHDSSIKPPALNHETISSELVSVSGTESPAIDGVPSGEAEELMQRVDFAQTRWTESGIQVQPIVRGEFATTVRLTGKVSLNQDRIAHIYPMVAGAVESVSVRLGEIVKADQLLATIHSREIGEAKLKLFQVRLQLELATTKHALQMEVANNVSALTAALRQRMPIEQIEVSFRNRPMGLHRERLLAAYANYVKSKADVERLTGVTQAGAVSGSQLLSAEANRNADLATYQSRLEEVDYELRTANLLVAQAVQEAETQVAVAETSLRILGCRDEEIHRIKPTEQGEEISHYSIRAPFDGTVLTKDIVLREQVRPDVMLMSIADLSTVWITADLYQEHLPLLQSLANQTIQIHSEVWPERVFQAQVFFAGEVMDENTRTVSVRALADNAEQLLKPGMFVTVDLPGAGHSDALLIPPLAVQEFAGEKFVFVHQGGDQFERRTILVGPANPTAIVVSSGLEAGESVVVSGGFTLKSLLLAELLGEE